MQIISLCYLCEHLSEEDGTCEVVKSGLISKRDRDLYEFSYECPHFFANDLWREKFGDKTLQQIHDYTEIIYALDDAERKAIEEDDKQKLHKIDQQRAEMARLYKQDKIAKAIKKYKINKGGE